MLPLWVGTFLQGFALWVPVEKLFMSGIGFDAATIGVMVGAYAALVPFAEVVSGVLADRWSRRGVLMLAGVAMLLSVFVGAVSWNVPTYVVAALLFGVYFAMYSGTVEAVVYDLVLEETGDGERYEREIGRVRFVESVALVASALAGGWLASVLSTRATYFLTLPFVVLYLVAISRFCEPRLHQAGERTSLRQHVTIAYRAITHRGRLVPIAAASIMAAMILQAMFEFGPLWLITLDASAVYYGPFWALLVATLGAGGLLAGRLRLDRPVPVAIVVLVMLAACLTLTSSRDLAALTIAMVALTFLLVVIGIHVSRLMHDAVPSTIRTGVASGISAVSWLVFTPFALVFGAVSKQFGVYVSGWMLTGAVALAGAALVWVRQHAPLR
ncbi:putative MFS family arabinose efflux permease [Kribbella antiqua]|uniref:Putative MFS family arabinose efflux permease n=2 Tax=Kribbella antiqua TaxID=2512217 RepID=A0A4R2J8T8_9ACTN|nr:putative MFS family arabinose efflux permease [Kribbella antiqua]